MSPTGTPRGRRPLQPSDRSASAQSTNSNSIGGGNNVSTANVTSPSSHYDRHRRQPPAHQTRRRLQVWMRQQWRGIPAATFDGNTDTAKTVATATITGNRRRQPPPSPSRTTPTSLNVVATSTTPSPTGPIRVAQVSNIDEALGALSSDYRVDHNTNVIHCVGRRLHYDVDNQPSEAVAAEEDDADDFNHCDWILDGYPEWEAQYQKTANLMEQLYPSSQETAVNNYNANLVLQFGSVMGQQEYQFASFSEAAASEEEEEEQVKASQEEQINGITSSGNVDDVQVASSFVAATPQESSRNHNFAQFWQSAVTAPTPQHTFDMGSASTYATGEDVDDNEAAAAAEIDPMDAWLVEKMAAKALGMMTPPPVATDLKSTKDHGDDNNDEDDDFGDFQEADPAGTDGIQHEIAAANPQDDEGYAFDGIVEEDAAQEQPAVDEALREPSVGGANEHDEDRDSIDGGSDSNSVDPPQNGVPLETRDESESATNNKFDEIPFCRSASAETPTHSPSKVSISTQHGIKTPAPSPPAKSMNDERYSVLEPPTPVTRNYHPSPSAFDVTGIDSPTSPFPHRLYFQESPIRDDSRKQTVSSQGPAGAEDHDDESSTRGESSIWTQESTQDEHSIPKEVQLKVPTNANEAPIDSTSVSIPQTVRLASASLANFSSSSFYFGRNATLFSSSMLDGGEDEPSIASSIASPEVKFLRRKHQSMEGLALETPKTARKQPKQKNDEIAGDDDDFDEDESVSLGSLGTLPENYLKHPDLDYTLQELKKLEWEWLPFWKMERLLDDDGEFCDTSTIPLLQDQITQRLSKLDAFYRKICKKVYKKIQPHAEEIMVANQATLDLQKNLQLAKMYLQRTQRAIETAKYGSPGAIPVDGFGVYGAMSLLQRWGSLASQKGLDDVIQAATEIFDMEKNILDRIKAYDVYANEAIASFESIERFVEELRLNCIGPPVARLQCLDSLRDRIDFILPKIFNARLHEWLEELAVQWCGQGESESSVADVHAYETLMESFCRLYQDNPAEGHLQASARAICTTIQTALLLETQKAFGRSLLWPSGSNDDDDAKYWRELEALEYNERLLDAARIPSWTHNLVTIRFDFEMKEESKHPLPHVFHRLCLLLTNTLTSLHALIEWHHQRTSSCRYMQGGPYLLFDAIATELPRRRASLWNACIQSMEGCMEEYLKLLGNKRLFQWDSDVCDDRSWHEDLQGLQEVSILIDQFLSMGPRFLLDTPAEYVNDGSLIREKFRLCCKRHVRTVHVETMNSLGGMLYREDWLLLPCHDHETAKDATNSDAGVRTIKNISKRLFQGVCREDTIERRSQRNGFAKTKMGYDLAEDIGSTNLFAVLRDSEAKQVVVEQPSSLDWEDEQLLSIAKLLSDSFSGQLLAEDCGIMTKSMLYGILPWCSRIFVLVEKLPFMSKEIILVLTNIFDLYISTAFRICAGNGRNERILLGIEKLERYDKHKLDEIVQRRFSSQSFGFGRRSQSITTKPKHSAQISNCIEAELCSFVMSNEKYEELAVLRDLLRSGQNSLKSIAKLDLVDKWVPDPMLEEDTNEDDFAFETARVLEKRVACTSNLLSLAAVTYVAVDRLSSYDEKLPALKQAVTSAIPLFMELSYRICAMRAIRGSYIVKEIASNETVWEESKLHEHPNEYVDNLCDFSVLLWKQLQTNPKKLPNGMLNAIWDGIVGGAFMTLLEGFSKVPFCSTEGRSLMSMDVAAFSSEMGSRSLRERFSSDPKIMVPQNSTPYQNAAYVDTYIKMYYFPHTDVMAWAEDNFRRYHLHHLLPLVLVTASNANEARKAVQTLTELYHCEKGSAAKTVRL